MLLATQTRKEFGWERFKLSACPAPTDRAGETRWQLRRGTQVESESFQILRFLRGSQAGA